MGGILNLAGGNRYNGGDVHTVIINPEGSGSCIGAVIANTVLDIGGLLLTGAVSGSGSTTMTAEEKAETIRQNQITGLYNII